jgi:hypothetical protein
MLIEEYHTETPHLRAGDVETVLTDKWQAQRRQAGKRRECWLYKRKSLEKVLEQAYKYPKIYVARLF